MDTRRKRSPVNFRAWLDYGMAALMVLMGIFILFPEMIVGFDFFQDSWFLQGAMKWVVGILFMLYGVFRAYRGYLVSRQQQ